MTRRGGIREFHSRAVFARLAEPYTIPLHTRTRWRCVSREIPCVHTHRVYIHMYARVYTRAAASAPHLTPHASRLCNICTLYIIYYILEYVIYVHYILYSNARTCSHLPLCTASHPTRLETMQYMYKIYYIAWLAEPCTMPVHTRTRRRCVSREIPCVHTHRVYIHMYARVYTRTFASAPHLTPHASRV
jgi:hypothetical protein